MIQDGYWSQELRKQLFLIEIWKRLSSIFHPLAEHRINAAILQSAVVVRKKYEDAAGAKRELESASMKMPHNIILDATIPVTAYPYKSDLPLISNRVDPDNYAGGTKKNIPAKEVCNQIIHSHVWGLAHTQKSLSGFLVSSDRLKTKELLYIEMTDWIAYLKQCI